MMETEDLDSERFGWSWGLFGYDTPFMEKIVCFVHRLGMLFLRTLIYLQAVLKAEENLFCPFSCCFAA